MRLVILSCLMMVLCGCVNHSNDYLKEGQQVSSVVVPAGVPPIKQAPYYPIPQNVTQAPVKPISLEPSTLTSTNN